MDDGCAVRLSLSSARRDVSTALILSIASASRAARSTDLSICRTVPNAVQ